GTRIYRVRLHSASSPPPNTIGELGPPPREMTLFSNRMSPAGVSMFYGAFDEATALKETRSRKTRRRMVATVATFRLVEDGPVLDLTGLPDVPSVFAGDWERRPSLAFLHDFVADLTAKIKKDGREHIEYVPSQVVTEYVRHRFTAQTGVSVRGIRYPSAQVKQ